MAGQKQKRVIALLEGRNNGDRIMETLPVLA